jgi:hypothetical protein
MTNTTKLKRLTIYIGYGDQGQLSLDKIQAVALSMKMTTSEFVRYAINKIINS